MRAAVVFISILLFVTSALAVGMSIIPTHAFLFVCGVFCSRLCCSVPFCFVYIIVGSHEKCFVYGVEDNIPADFTPVCIYFPYHHKKTNEENIKNFISRTLYIH